MSNKLKTLSVYDEGLGFVDELCDDIDFVLAAEDTFVIFPEDEFFEFNFDNQDTSITDGIEAEYGKPMSELSTEVALYWMVARGMRLGEKSDAVWMRDDSTLVWC